MSLAFAAWSMARFGGASDAISYLSGKRVLAAPGVISLGTCANGSGCTPRVHLRNISTVPVQVVGATTSCSCVATTNLPVVIGPGETVGLDATMMVEGEPGRLVEQTIDYLTDSAESPRVRVLLQARVSSD